MAGVSERDSVEEDLVHDPGGTHLSPMLDLDNDRV